MSIDAALREEGAMSKAKRYNLRPMIDGDNVMDWPRDLRRGPYVVIATDYDDLLARCEAAEARLAETEWSCAGKGPDSSLPSTPSPDEYESVGWQYKVPGISGGGEWRDSPHNYNGSRYTESREIFAKRAAPPEPAQEHIDARAS